MLLCYLSGIAVTADGLPGWERSRPLLARQAVDAEHRAGDYRPAILPPNERRRTTPVIKLALQVASEAVDDSGLEPSTLPSVFASADGDSYVVDRICQSMHLPGHPVSPTHFHNSVHNAAAAYWSLCARSRAASTSVAGGNFGFAVGLVEAATQLFDGAPPAVLLAVYDLPMPPPLKSAHQARAAFGVALVLSREPLPSSCARLQLKIGADDKTETRCQGGLEQLRTANAAARALPLLCQIATGTEGEIRLPYSESAVLCASVQPC